MKTAKTWICMICLLTVSCMCMAQNQSRTKSVIKHEPIKESDFSQPSAKPQSGGMAGKEQLQGTSGSPYLFDEWNDGVITMKDKSLINGKKYRYNLYTQQMQFIEDKDTVAIANPEDIEKIQFGGKTFIFSAYDSQGAIDNGYFELISDGNCRILKKWVVLYHVIDEQEPAIKATADEKSEFLRDCNCFLQFGDSPAIKASHNKKEFVACFKEDQDEVNTFIKQNGIKMKSESDLKAVVDYYNTLQE